MSSKNKAPPPAVSAEDMFSVEKQVENINFRETGNRNGKNTAGPVFSTYLKKPFPGNLNMPTVKIVDAPLGSVGKAVEQRRGINVTDYRLNDGSKGHIIKLAVCLTRADNGDIIKACRTAWEAFCKSHDPLKHSMWYQSKFPELDDGTKVHLATIGIDSPAEYCTMEIEDQSQMYDAPARTWGPSFYSDDDTARWYPKVRVQDSYSIFCRKSNGKLHGKVSEDGVAVYNKDGVSIANTNMLKCFLGSKFYQGNQWRCTTMLEITSMEVRCGTRDRFRDTTNAKFGVYPVFTLRTGSSIIFTEVDESTTVSGLTPEQRDSAIMAHLFEGFPMPTRKRRVRDTAATGDATTASSSTGKKPKTGEAEAHEEDTDHDSDDE